MYAFYYIKLCLNEVDLKYKKYVQEREWPIIIDV